SIERLAPLELFTRTPTRETPLASGPPRMRLGFGLFTLASQNDDYTVSSLDAHARAAPSRLPDASKAAVAEHGEICAKRGIAVAGILTGFSCRISFGDFE